jgi:hypothetical protein
VAVIWFVAGLFLVLVHMGSQPAPMARAVSRQSSSSGSERLACLKAAMDHIARLIDRTLVHQGVAPRP